MDSPVVEAVVLGGRYRLGSLLGSGGMAQVYDGWDERLARPVAVKLLRPDLAASDHLRRRFEFEARAAAGLTHRHVVSVYDAGDDNGRSYIVMERLSGESLADRIGHGPMDSAWLRRLAGEVLAALGVAHEAGIVHRDIKPGNILFGPDGGAKVADFGIARVMEPGASGEAGSADTAAALTGAGLVVGTPAYLAPERAMGEPATPQSDLYSLGVVLYEALTGRKPYAGVTPAAIAAAAVQGAVENPSLLRPDADPELVAVIGRAMALDPSHRYPSAADMAADLRRSTPPPTAVMPVVTGPGVGSPVAPTVADAPAGLAPLGGAYVAPSADPWGHLAPGTTSETHGTRADPSPRRCRRRRPPFRGRTGLVLLGVAAIAAAALALAFATPGSGSRAANSATSGSPAGASSVTTVAANPNTSARGPQATTATTGLAAVGVNQSDPIGAALQNEAKRLARSKSTAAGPLAAGLNSVAAITDSNTRPAAASTLLDQTVQWYQDGRLTTSEYVVAAALLHNAGAPVPPPPTVKHGTGDTGGAGAGGG